MEYVLRLRGITKKYNKTVVLDNINLSIKKGQVYGLIGLNGAGKSTIMNIIAGLIIPNSGSVELFGAKNIKDVQKNRKRIGALVNKPSFYGGKTVFQNMNLNRIQQGIPGEKSIDKIMEITGLSEYKNTRAGKLSLGNQQSLGIAMALLGEPELLILDEPTNGLDPMKIIKLRKMLKRINQEYGTTMLISSHILKELYQLASDFGIIHNGKMVKESNLQQLKKDSREYIYLKVDDTAKAVVVIREKLKINDYEVEPNNAIRLYNHVDEPGIVSKILVRNGIGLEEIQGKGVELEEYFANIIGRNENE